MADLTPIRPPNIPPALWNQMSPEDQQQARIDYFGAEAGPSIGGFAPAPPPPPPVTEPPRTPAAVKPTGPTWAYVRSLNSFPGNHPYFADDRSAGITGYFLEAHDPFLETGAAACRDAGFDVGVWADPHGASAQAFAADIIGAAHRIGATTIAPDPESTGKGSPGSPGWVWNQDAANFIRALDPSIKVIVTPTPDQDDFNYNAWVSNGGLVWVQLYGAKLTDLFNADEVINRVAANGVPRNLIGALIPAGAIALYVPELQKLGVTHWAIYTIDDVNATDRQTPFGAPGTTPGPDDSQPASGDGSQPPGDGSDEPDIPPASAKPEDDADDGYSDAPTADDEDWALLAADIGPEDVDDFLSEDDDTADVSGLRFLSAKRKKQWVTIAPYANRRGHGIHNYVIVFVRRLAIAYGHPLLIICGTAHNQYVKGTHRQSQHWTGDAADIGPFHGRPGSPPRIDPNLTRLGRTALLVAGAKRSWAMQQTGGFWTVSGVNIGFNTTIGGNHYNHLHVGLLHVPLGPIPGGITIPGTTEPNSPEAPHQPPPVKLPARVRINKPWDRLMQALDPELKARSVTMRQVGRNIKSRVK